MIQMIFKYQIDFNRTCIWSLWFLTIDVFESLNHSFTLLSVKNRMVTVVKSWHTRPGFRQTFTFTEFWVKTIRVITKTHHPQEPGDVPSRILNIFSGKHIFLYSNKYLNSGIGKFIHYRFQYIPIWFRYTFCWYCFVIRKIVNISLTSGMKSICPIFVWFVNTFCCQGMILERLN